MGPAAWDQSTLGHISETVMQQLRARQQRRKSLTFETLLQSAPRVAFHHLDPLQIWSSMCAPEVLASIQTHLSASTPYHAWPNDVRQIAERLFMTHKTRWNQVMNQWDEQHTKCVLNNTPQKRLARTEHYFWTHRARVLQQVWDAVPLGSRPSSYLDNDIVREASVPRQLQPDPDSDALEDVETNFTQGMVDQKFRWAETSCTVHFVRLSVDAPAAGEAPTWRITYVVFDRLPTYWHKLCEGRLRIHVDP